MILPSTISVCDILLRSSLSFDLVFFFCVFSHSKLAQIPVSLVPSSLSELWICLFRIALNWNKNVKKYSKSHYIIEQLRNTLVLSWSFGEAPFSSLSLCIFQSRNLFLSARLFSSSLYLSSSLSRVICTKKHFFSAILSPKIFGLLKAGILANEKFNNLLFYVAYF